MAALPCDIAQAGFFYAPIRLMVGHSELSATRIIRFSGNGCRPKGSREGITPLWTPGDCGMFPVTYDPKLNYCILVPYYDPLIEYYANGTGSPLGGRTEYRPSRGGYLNSADYHRAACSRREQSLRSSGAITDGGVMVDARGTSPPPLNDRAAACFATGTPRSLPDGV